MGEGALDGVLAKQRPPLRVDDVDREVEAVGLLLNDIGRAVGGGADTGDQLLRWGHDAFPVDAGGNPTISTRPNAPPRSIRLSLWSRSASESGCRPGGHGPDCPG